MTDPQSDAQAVALATYPELQRLVDLCATGGWGWVLNHGDNGLLVSISGMRQWLDGTVDLISFRNITEARAARHLAGRGWVWKRTGTLVQMIDNLLELPGPMEPLLLRGHLLGMR